MDGYITIGTKLSTKDLENDLKNLKKDLTNIEKQNKILLKAKVEAETDISNIEEGRKAYESLLNESLSMATSQEEINQIMEDNKSIIDFWNAGYEKAQENLKDINDKIKANATAEELVKNKIAETNQELQKQQNTENINNGLKSIISNVTKWGLALIGIRGAYSMISRAMSTLSQQDENLRNQIEYIQWALAKVVEPIVRFILDIVIEIMGYVNQIWRTLFGKDLFKGPQEFASSMKSASKSAKEIQKYLAGFDEMNILGNNTQASAGTGLSGRGAGAPPKNNEKPIAKGIEFLKEKVEELKTNTEDALDSINNPEQYDRAYGPFGGLVRSAVETNAGISKAFLGAGGTFKSVIKMVHGFFTQNEDELIEGTKGISRNLLETAKGLGHGIKGFVFEMPFEAGKLVGNYLLKNISKVNEGVKLFTKDASRNIGRVFSIFKTNNKDINTGINTLYDSTIGKLKNIFGFSKKSIDETGKSTQSLASKLMEQAGLVEKSTTSLGSRLLQVGEGIRNGTIRTSEDIKNILNPTLEGTKNTLKGVGSEATNVSTQASNGINKVGGAGTSVSQTLSNVISKAKDYADSILKSTDNGLSQVGKKATSVSAEVTNALSKSNGEKAGKGFASGLVEFLTRGFNLSIDRINEWLTRIKGIKFEFAGHTFNLALPQLKRIGLAKGTILNNPGRGVPIGNAIAGEAGREAVLPLSDSRLLEELGSTIGRYITINLTNVTELDGTTIARKMKNLTNNDNFLRNR